MGRTLLQNHARDGRPVEPGKHREPPALTHTYTTRIYYADTDAGGVVYHATYLAIAERARTEALREADLPHSRMLAEHDCHFMVRRIEVEYLRPARLDEMLAITTRTLAQRAATITLAQVFSSAEGAVLANLTVQLACVNATTGRPARIPPPWRERT